VGENIFRKSDKRREGGAPVDHCQASRGLHRNGRKEGAGVRHSAGKLHTTTRKSKMIERGEISGGRNRGIRVHAVLCYLLLSEVANASAKRRRINVISGVGKKISDSK